MHGEICFLARRLWTWSLALCVRCGYAPAAKAMRVPFWSHMRPRPAPCSPRSPLLFLTGTGLLVVVRAGVLRPSDWFILGAAVGRVRALIPPHVVGVGAASETLGGRGSSGLVVEGAPGGSALSQSVGAAGGDRNSERAVGGRGAGSGGSGRDLSEAAAGSPVVVAVAWGDEKGGGGFAVGETLAVLPKASAVALAEYRDAVQRFVASGVSLESEEGEGEAGQAAVGSHGVEAGEPGAAEGLVAGAGGGRADDITDAASVSEGGRRRGARGGSGRGGGRTHPGGITGSEIDAFESDDEEEEMHQHEHAPRLQLAEEASESAQPGHGGHRPRSVRPSMPPGASARSVLRAAPAERVPLPAPAGFPPPKPVAVAVRAHTAGELQALLDFLRPRALEREDDRRVVLVSCGVGAPREEDIELLRQARKLGFEASLYTLNTRLDAKLLQRLREAQVRAARGRAGERGVGVIAGTG